MATAAKLATIPPAELSVAEEYAQLTGEEIFAASQETSSQYNGIVLAKAIVIVQTRMRCSSLPALARLIGIGKVSMYRYAKARPVPKHVFHRAIRDLAILLDEEGGRR
jgi:hypothetical protein